MQLRLYKNSQFIEWYHLNGPDGFGYSYVGSNHRSKDCMRKNPTPNKSGDSQNL